MSTPPREIKPVDDNATEVGCDGGGADALGHPLVYLRFEGKREVACYYCGQRFAKAGATAADARGAA